MTALAPSHPARDLPAEPPADLRYHHRLHLRRSLRQLAGQHEVVITLAEREFRSRYKQAILGSAWSVLTPLLLMVVFVLIFKRVARLDTGGVPYPLFSYVGLLPWTFFSSSVSRGAMSLVNNVPLLTKVFCPREVFPLSSVAVGVLDTIIASSALVVLFFVNGFKPYTTAIWVPLLTLVLLMATVGIVLTLSAVVVYLRDLRHALPIILQLGLLVTPVAYGIDIIPEGYRPLYSFVNPLGPLIDSFRRTILLGQNPDLFLLSIAACSSTLFLLGGYILFKRLEVGFADVA